MRLLWLCLGYAVVAGGCSKQPPTQSSGAYGGVAGGGQSGGAGGPTGTCQQPGSLVSSDAMCRLVIPCEFSTTAGFSISTAAAAAPGSFGETYQVSPDVTGVASRA